MPTDLLFRPLVLPGMALGFWPYRRSDSLSDNGNVGSVLRAIPIQVLFQDFASASGAALCHRLEQVLGQLRNLRRAVKSKICRFHSQLLWRRSDQSEECGSLNVPRGSSRDPVHPLDILGSRRAALDDARDRCEAGRAARSRSGVMTFRRHGRLGIQANGLLVLIASGQFNSRHHWRIPSAFRNMTTSGLNVAETVRSFSVHARDPIGNAAAEVPMSA